MTRSAPLLGGSYDGLRLRLDGAELPLTLVLDGDKYDLTGGVRACYRARRSAGWGERRRFDSTAKRIVVQAVATCTVCASASAWACGSPRPARRS